MSIPILLVNPYIHDFCAYDLWMKPLGLYWLAGYLEQYGYQVTLLDCLDRYHPILLESQGRKRPHGSKYGCGPLPKTIIPKPPAYCDIPRDYHRFGLPIELLERMCGLGPQPQAILVGSMMTYWYPGVLETIALLRRHFPGVPLALGGVYATLCPDHARQTCNPDVVLSGPGEIKALRWLDQVCGQHHDYPEHDIIAAADLPEPAHHLASFRSPAVVATSLGCPLRCTYCASRLLQPQFRQRPWNLVLDEIVHLVKNKHVRDIAFYDDALLINAAEHIEPLVRAIGERRLQARFHTPNGMHSRLMTAELARAFRRAEIITVRFSYERSSRFDSGAPERIEDPELAAAVENMKAAGYGTRSKIEVYVKTSLPGQSPAEIIEAFAYVHKLGAHIRIADYSPVPGTPDYRTTMDLHGLDGDNPLYHNNSALPFFIDRRNIDFYNQLKSLVGTLNFCLERGINLTADNRLAALFNEAARKIIEHR